MRKDTAIRAGARATLAALVLLSGTLAHAAIPASERNVLLSLYAGTNGAGWTTSTGWNGAAGTECSWYGISCDTAGTTVTAIQLPQNDLTGSLPALTGLPNLVFLDFLLNHLTGPIPSLAGWANLYFVRFLGNQLTGPIPSLTGLTKLYTFDVGRNQLSGPLPSLSGLKDLGVFNASDNQLTGPIPALAGLTNLSSFNVGANQLTGPIPALAGLTNLYNFNVAANQLTGPIPALAGLTELSQFFVDRNQLTGPIPALAGLTKLSSFRVDDNQLTGEAPAVPSPSALLASGSALCPNALNPAPNAAWDAATGSTPWHIGCTGVASFATDLTDIWWNATESGWGMQLVHTGTFIFGTIYLYGPGGEPSWVSFELDRTGTSPLTFAGPLYVTTGPYFGGAFDPAVVTAREAGTMTFVATDATHGQISYSVDGVVVTKLVTRQPLTFDDYSGNYVAAATGTRTGCLDAANDGTTTVPGTVQIIQSGASMSAAWTFEDGDVCTDTGTYSQLGRMGMLVANYSCTSGDAGTSTYSEMTHGLGAFSARLAMHSTTLGCTTAGRVSGLIPN